MQYAGLALDEHWSFMTVHTPFHPLLAVLVMSSLLGTPMARAQDSASVSGAVIDAITGAGILGVRVVVLGSAHWTTTRSDGRYTIEGVAPANPDASDPQDPPSLSHVDLTA